MNFALCPKCKSMASLAESECNCGHLLPWSKFIEHLDNPDLSIKNTYGALKVIKMSGKVIDGEMPTSEWVSSSRPILYSSHSACAALIWRSPLNDWAWGQLHKTISNALIGLDKAADLYDKDPKAARRMREGVHAWFIPVGRLLDTERQTRSNMFVWLNESKGHTEARRYKNASRCSSLCTALEKVGWLPIRSMVPLGETDNGGDCSCGIETR